jgi:predicted lipoprotein with Yx(FWY)xxD motif
MRSVISIAAATIAVFSVSGFSAGNAPPARMEMTDDGMIWVTPSGMTLYTYAADDTTPGKSRCSNIPVREYSEEQSGLGMVPVIGADIQKSCAAKMPPYLAAADASPSEDFGFIERTEGGKQWTYRGHPLYLSIRDHQPGDRNALSVSGFGFRGAFRLAVAPLELPAGLKLIARDDGLTLATADYRPVFTPRAGLPTKVCAGCEDDLFKTAQAPAMATVSGDWSIVDAGAGRHQYAFKGKPLYIAPNSMSDTDIEETGQWQAVVYRKGPGIPDAIRTQFALIGGVYTDKQGHTLYTYNCNSPARDGTRCDEPGDPAGYWVALCGAPEECAKRWHPYLAAQGARPVGAWSIVDITYPVYKDSPGVVYPPDLPHVKVWAYRGTPLWTYYEDKAPGDLWGHWIKWIGGSSFTALRVPGRDLPEN